MAAHGTRLQRFTKRVTGIFTQRRARAVEGLRVVEIARKAAAKVQARKVVRTAPEVEVDGSEPMMRPVIPAGRKALNVLA